MSTRCNIIVQDSNNSCQLYHHCDGYPSGVGAELKEFLNTVDFSRSAEEFAEELEKWDHSYENEGIFATPHGDIEYLYKIDLTQGILTCTDDNNSMIFEHAFYMDEEEKSNYERGYRKGIEDAIQMLQKLLK